MCVKGKTQEEKFPLNKKYAGDKKRAYSSIP